MNIQTHQCNKCWKHLTNRHSPSRQRKKCYDQSNSSQARSKPQDLTTINVKLRTIVDRIVNGSPSVPIPTYD